jgi:beta-galactosidase
MKIWHPALLLFVFFFSKASVPQKTPPPIQFDASQPALAPETGYLHMGGVSSTGHRLEVNSRYLIYDGKPWLPVMGEFHFSRFPEKYWEEEILKMKAGGVQVIATYIFWIHHEEIEGQFDWTGQRDLHRFVSLCARHGLYVYLRIGPWDHGEVRNGGFPDWLMQKKIPLRRNDPEYLKYVSRWYGQVGQQIQGQLWKDGGPIFGVQIENEYGETGPGAGAEHLAELRRIAIAAGIAPPLFSVTGWPGHDYPTHDVIPVAGGYPDDFWTGLKTDAPPNPVYLFHSDRALGDLGAMALGDPDGKIDLRHYPNFGAEEGGGMETSYHRRPLIQPEDIAALTLTNIGSGVNLYGYYMFHGGTNPKGRLSTLQESQATGYPNDLPVLNYDYQAPIGEYGQQRESFRKVKLLNLFLSAFGPDLAPMDVFMPSVQPANPADASVPRVALRARGDRGFLFINNYVRKLEMPERKSFQASIHLPSGTITVPQTPIDLPADSAYFWPINLDLGPTQLRYSTTQLITRINQHQPAEPTSADQANQPTYFFFAVPGVRPEFVFEADSSTTVTTTSGTVTPMAGALSVRGLVPGPNTAIYVSSRSQSIRIVLLSEKDAENFWLIQRDASDNRDDAALLSAAGVFASGNDVHLRSTDPAAEQASLFSPSIVGSNAIPAEQNLWKIFTFPIRTRSIHFQWEKIRDAAPAGASRMGPFVDFRKLSVPIVPADDQFDRGSAWKLTIPAQPMDGLSDIFLRIDYVGDVARFFQNDALLDDDFYKGNIWEIGLKRFLPHAFDRPFELHMIPLRRDTPIYLDAEAWDRLPAGGQLAEVQNTSLQPEYEVILRLPESKDGTARDTLPKTRGLKTAR